MSSSKYVLPGLPTLDSRESPMATPFPSGASNNPSTPSQAAAVGSNETLETKILRVLHNSDQPLPALTVAKQVGLVTAKQVNPTLYKMEKEGKVNSKKIPGTSRPIWTISRERTMSLESHSQAAASNAVLQTGVAIPPLASIGTRDLYTKAENESQVVFTKVNAPTDPSPVVEPVTVSEATQQPATRTQQPATRTQQPATPHPIQESSVPEQDSEQAQRPIQVTVDDRDSLDPNPDPVTTPDPANFATRSKKLGQDDINQAKKAVRLENTANNTETESGVMSTSSSSLTLETASSPHTDVYSSSLSSLSLDDSSATPPGPSGASPSTGESTRTSRKKGVNMAIRFPGQDK